MGFSLKRKKKMLEKKTNINQEVELEKSFEELDEEKFEKFLDNLDGEELDNLLKKNKSNQSLKPKVEKYLRKKTYLLVEEVSRRKTDVLISSVIAVSCVFFEKRIAEIVSPVLPGYYLTYTILFVVLISLGFLGIYLHFCRKFDLPIDYFFAFAYLFGFILAIASFLKMNPPLF